MHVVFSADPILSQLSRDLKQSRKAAYATGTSKNHRTQWRTYLYFTLHFNLVFLPASLHTICLYCPFLSPSMTPPSVRNYLNGVKLLHLMLGFEFHVFLPMSSNSRFVVLTGWHNIVHIALPLLHPPYFTPLLLAGLISTRSISPFCAPFCLPFYFLPAFPTLFLSPSFSQEFRSTGAFVVAMLSQLITVYVFSLLGLKLFNSVSES